MWLGLYMMPWKPSCVLFQISNLLIETDFSLSSFRSFSFKDNESKNKNRYFERTFLPAEDDVICMTNSTDRRDIPAIFTWLKVTKIK